MARGDDSTPPSSLPSYTVRFFALRTPLLPEPTWPEPSAARAEEGELEAAITRDNEAMSEAFRALLEDPRVREALFVASPDLSRALETWLSAPGHPHARNVPVALYRYLCRMGTRPTPFGLFATMASGPIGERSSLGPGASLVRHTRLDMGYLSALCVALEPELRPGLVYRPTPSLASFSDQYRYAEARVHPSTRAQHNDQVSLARTPAVDAVLAATPAVPATLAAAVCAIYPEVSLEDALGFVDGLIEARVLVSELSPPITGEDGLADLVGQLRTLASERAEIPGQVAKALATLDAEGAGHPPERYTAITELLQALPAAPDPRALFHVDLYRDAPITLGQAVVAQLQEGLALLSGLAPPGPDEVFSNFIQRFEERWGESEQPLVLVLDDELGLGFGGAGRSADPSPLLEGLPFPEGGARAQGRFGAREAYLLRRVLETASAGTWELDDADLVALADQKRLPLPDALQMMVVLAAPDEHALDRGEGEIWLQGAGGPSGAQLFGRFCHGAPGLRARVEAHLRAEEALRPDAVFAEVVYSPEGRMGNVICRPRLRTLEIPYMGRGAAEPEQTILISDLWVSVRGGRVRLRSERLNREVIPSLCSAHNHVAADLPIYRFLAMVGRQGLTRQLGWIWGALSELPTLPRVRRGRFLLSPARWRLSKEDLAPLVEARAGAALWRAARDLRARRALPRHLLLEQQDNVLPVDLEQAVALDALVAAARGGAELTLRERWPLPEALVLRGPGGAYAHELVVPMVRSGPPQTSPPLSVLPPTRRAWLPGSPWLYLQIYCGTLTADAVLTEVIAPLVAEARAEGILQGWYFIRYADPENHLRVRFLAADGAATLLSRAEAALEPWRQDGRVWRVRADTYLPELERYGGPEGMALAERLFEADSDAVLALLALLDGDAGSDARWRMALRSLHLLLEDLGVPMDARLRLLGELRRSWAERLGVDRAFEAALNARYRVERASLEALVQPDWDPEHPLAPGFEVFAARGPALRAIGAELGAAPLSTSLESLVQSYAHMLVNRTMRSEANQVEVVLYELLIRLYKSAAARASSDSPDQRPQARRKAPSSG